MKKTLIILVVVVALLAVLYSVMAHRAPKTPPPTTQQIWNSEGVPIETATTTLGDMEQTIEVTGDIVALDKVTLSAKIGGRVAQVYAREGDPVSAGETVVMLDQQDAMSNLQSAEGALESAVARLSQAKTNAKVTRIQSDSAIEQAQAALNQAKAKLAVVKMPSRSQEQMVAENNVASAKANLENAEATYKRYQKLLKDGAVSQATFDGYEAQYKVAKAQCKSAEDQLSLVKEGGRSEDVTSAKSQVEVAQEQLRSAKANASQNLLRQEDIKSAVAAVRQAQAAVALARQQLSYTYVKSSISGALASRLTEPGQVIAAGQALGDVVSLNSLYFKGDVSEKEFASINKGQHVNVQIDAFPGKTISGTVIEIYPSGSTISRNFPVRIRIDEGKGVRPGMFARGKIVTGFSHNVLLIPKDAIDERKGTQSVFTVGSDKKVKRHVVHVLRENRNYVEIATPTDLKVGDIVVTEGRQNLQDGAKVKTSNGD